MVPVTHYTGLFFTAETFVYYLTYRMFYKAKCHNRTSIELLNIQNAFINKSQQSLHNISCCRCHYVSSIMGYVWTNSPDGCSSDAGVTTGTGIMNVNVFVWLCVHMSYCQICHFRNFMSIKKTKCLYFCLFIVETQH